MKLVIAIGLVFVMLSCGPELKDCDSKGDVLAGAWIVKEIYIDDQKQNSDAYKAYRLKLDEDGEFERSQPAGFPDAGNWSLDGGETVLILTPSILHPKIIRSNRSTYVSLC
ncbi:MAG: hypothetical protein WDO15_23540 [Bacteroidota bacterium]